MEEELQGLNLIELLDLLEPVPAPDPIPMVPQTEGWIWLGAALLVLTAYGLWRWRAWYRANAYRRAALTELKRASDDPAAIAGVLRRTALAGFPRDKVASLYGESWLSFLDRTDGKARFAGSDAGQALITAPYHQTDPDPDLPGKARRWIKHHKRDTGDG